MKLPTITIKGHELPILVNNWVLRQYGNSVDAKDLQGTLQALSFIGKYDGKNKDQEVEWADLEKLARIGFMGIVEGCEEEGVDCLVKEKDLFNAIHRPDVAATIIVAVITGLPVPKEAQELVEAEADESSKKK